MASAFDVASFSAFGAQSLVTAIGQSLGRQGEAPARFAVALSGGADSAMLAVHAALFCQQHPGHELHFFHVHHGLQSVADAWQAHAHDLAQMLRVPCHSRRVAVDLGRGDGMEAAARTARYRAFEFLGQRTGVRHILLAHHRDDQAETVLLRLLRGAGPAGLAAMAPQTERDGLLYLRPWLDVARKEILRLAHEFEQLSGWAPVHDPTNADAAYTRAAVREMLVPALDRRWPGWQTTLTRHARQSAETQELLLEVARSDFAQLDAGPDGLSFSLVRWRELSHARQALVLRYWLAQHGLRMPSDARLQDLMRQLRELHALGHDRQMRVKHGAAWIRCARGRVYLEVDSSEKTVL